VEVVGDGVFVDIAERSFLGAQAASEVTEVIDGERNIGVQGFANCLAVIDSFSVCQRFEIGFQAVGNL